MFKGPLCVLLGEVSVRSFAHFLIGFFVYLVLRCMSSLYILEINSLSKVSWANMSSYMVGSLVFLLIFSLVIKKLFILMRSDLFLLFFMSLSLGDILEKILLRGISEIFLPMFSCRTSMESELIFNSFFFFKHYL